MPKVGEKEFEYDEEGMAEAEAEAANTGQNVEVAAEQDTSSMIDKIMEDITPETSEEPNSVDEALESQTEEATPETTPDEGLMLQLFEIVYGGSFDPASEEDQQRLQQIQSILANDPEAAEKLKSGELSMTEFAIRVHRDDPKNTIG